MSIRSRDSARRCWIPPKTSPVIGWWIMRRLPCTADIHCNQRRIYSVYWSFKAESHQARVGAVEEPLAYKRQRTCWPQNGSLLGLALFDIAFDKKTKYAQTIPPLFTLPILGENSSGTVLVPARSHLLEVRHEWMVSGGQGVVRLALTTRQNGSWSFQGRRVGWTVGSFVSCWGLRPLLNQEFILQCIWIYGVPAWQSVRSTRPRWHRASSVP